MIEDSKQSLVENFMQHFSIELADQKQQLEIFRLRYRVYCEEFHYESAESFCEPLEYDQYDQQSLHCIVIHRRNRIPAGCVRLVLTHNDRTKDPLPFEKYCASSLNEELLKSLNLDRQYVCEISRLAVDGIFRQSHQKLKADYGELFNFSDAEQKTFPLISVSCFLAATYLTEMSNRTQVFAMMEPFLPRMLKRAGISFERVGYDMSYHGIRAAYFIRTQSALENMHPELRELYNWIKYNIENNIR